MPRLTRSVTGAGIQAITLGHPLLDDYLAFVAARARANTWLAVAYDLKVFFETVGKEPAGVRRADVFAFLTAQRAPRRGETVVRLEDGEPGLAARTIARRLSSVSGLFAYLAAREDSGVLANPVPRGLASRRPGRRGRGGVPLVRTPRSAGDKIRGSFRVTRTSGTPWRGRARSRRVGSPRGTGLAATSPRACKNAKNPDTIDSRRRTVAADTPASSPPRSTGCSAPCSPARPVRWAVMNASTSAGPTSSGGLPTTEKNTLKSYAAASTVFGRHRPPRNSRYTSASGTPTPTTSPPKRSSERTTQRSAACTARLPSSHTTQPHQGWPK